MNKPIVIKQTGDFDIEVGQSAVPNMIYISEYYKKEGKTFYSTPIEKSRIPELIEALKQFEK